ncbi:ROK family protein [Flavihumibacter rivuli]|uniref:ROK family protein n=1 Tax=Flavihumibacter rivuli TaxID=2838156 RepID=UPI001EFBAE36|nr:ROK family protein [Flavihumibacter rivuli]ULQ54888.1 ROK family protein [Flavihumibacter rivuli]
MSSSQYIGLDLGGTQLRGGRVGNGGLITLHSEPTQANGKEEEVVEQVCVVIEKLLHPEVKAIGIGVPGLVELATGTVFDIVNIPSWKEVPLQSILEERFQLPVRINNDANCFALGEYLYGKGRSFRSMVGVTIGTGLGAGIIVEGKLFSGIHCGAGEYGMLDYLDHNVEYYASGSFFQNQYAIDGKEVFERAKAGDAEALAMYAEYGKHLGNAIKFILYTLNVELIVLGGSVKAAWPYFQQAMWEQVRTYAYQPALHNLQIEVTELENSAILGTAALYEDALR